MPKKLEIQEDIGHVEPYRTTVKHGVCGEATVLIPADAEAHARFPGFYHHIECAHCGGLHPASEFTWVEDGEPVKAPDEPVAARPATPEEFQKDQKRLSNVIKRLRDRMLKPGVKNEEGEN